MLRSSSNYTYQSGGHLATMALISHLLNLQTAFGQPPCTQNEAQFLAHRVEMMDVLSAKGTAGCAFKLQIYSYHEHGLCPLSIERPLKSVFVEENVRCRREDTEISGILVERNEELFIEGMNDKY